MHKRVSNPGKEQEVVISHLATVVTSGCDVIQWVKTKKMNRRQVYCNSCTHAYQSNVWIYFLTVSCYWPQQHMLGIVFDTCCHLAPKCKQYRRTRIQFYQAR